MSPRDVEFRMLQVVVSAVGDERVTVALLHWDGGSLRFASSPKRIPPTLAAAEDLRATVRALRNEVVHTTGRQPLLDIGVDLLHEVREGRGGVVVWSPIRRGRTSSPEAHFEQLARDLDLRVLGERAHGQIGPPRLTTELVSFGERLRASIPDPDRVGVRVPVRGLREYESPLSWRNRMWHHSFPTALHSSDPDVVVRRVEAALGRIEVCVPVDAGGVVVAVHPAVDAVAHQLDEIGAFVEKKHGHRVRIVRAPLASTHEPTLDALEARIREEIAESHDESPRGPHRKFSLDDE